MKSTHTRLRITSPLGWDGYAIFNSADICWTSAPIWNGFIGLTKAQCQDKAHRLGYTVTDTDTKGD